MEPLNQNNRHNLKSLCIPSELPSLLLTSGGMLGVLLEEIWIKSNASYSMEVVIGIAQARVSHPNSAKAHRPTLV
jgi:hypothetical protein